MGIQFKVSIFPWSQHRGFFWQQRILGSKIFQLVGIIRREVDKQEETIGRKNRPAGEIVVHSATKFPIGHGNVLCGEVGNFDELMLWIFRSWVVMNFGHQEWANSGSSIGRTGCMLAQWIELSGGVGPTSKRFCISSCVKFHMVHKANQFAILVGFHQPNGISFGAAQGKTVGVGVGGVWIELAFIND